VLQRKESRCNPCYSRIHQDFNADVLERVTKQNVSLNINSSANCCSFTFLACDWADCESAALAVPPASFDILLTCETLYAVYLLHVPFLPLLLLLSLLLLLLLLLFLPTPSQSLRCMYNVASLPSLARFAAHALAATGPAPTSPISHQLFRLAHFCYKRLCLRRCKKLLFWCGGRLPGF
jgi:hypothetical protein